ncbi:MAG: flagellar protein [Lachnospiraceae bacterium]|nr:flagellar protein [Lachnospiraceae bacterium]
MEMNVQTLYAAGLSKNLTSRPIAASSETKSEKAFGNILTEKEKEARQVKFSKHASLRMSDRGLEMSDEQLGRLSDGTDMAANKGINDSLVMIDDLAFIVNVPSRTVITALEAGNDTNVFTNINGAVIA